MLLNAGADVNAKKADGVTAIILASQFGQIEAVKMLLAAGADVKAKAYGATALEPATRQGHSEIVKLLRAAGAKIAFLFRFGSFKDQHSAGNWRDIRIGGKNGKWPRRPLIPVVGKKPRFMRSPGILIDHERRERPAECTRDEIRHIQHSGGAEAHLCRELDHEDHQQRLL